MTATLIGSPKQIAWAEDIRRSVANDLAAAVDQYGNHTPEERQEILAILLGAVMRVREARRLIGLRREIRSPECALALWATPAERARVREIDTVVYHRVEAEVASTPPERPDAAALIARLRHHGWRVTQIAARLGVHRSTIHHWQTSQRTPNDANLARLNRLTKSYEGWNPPK